MSEIERPPFPPFSYEDAVLKVRKAEDAWNGKNPEAIALAYSVDSKWRNRSEFITGRNEIIEFLKRKWSVELNYKLIKEIWCHSENRIAVRFSYEWCNAENDWFRSFGNENWEFDEHGLMKSRHASINDVPIQQQDRKFSWSDDVRPQDFPGMTELGL